MLSNVCHFSTPIVFLVLQVVLMSSALEEVIVINEISISTGQQIETREFVELKFTDFCLFKRWRNAMLGKGPKLNGYYLLQLVCHFKNCG